MAIDIPRIILRVLFVEHRKNFFQVFVCKIAELFNLYIGRDFYGYLQQCDLA